MTKIEWTDATWNPIVGCSVLTPGCTNCYAMRMARRLEAMTIAHEAKHGGDPGPLVRYRGLTKDSRAGAVWTGKVALAPDRVLAEPLRRRKPTMYFVNSMGDLFHEDVPDEWIARVWAVMYRAPRHTFQVLTKRGERMRDFVSRCANWEGWITHNGAPPKGYGGDGIIVGLDDRWPLPNVWLGVSAERQKEADERIPLLLDTPAAVRFVSVEPMLGPVDFDGMWEPHPNPGMHINMLECLDWIIVGGESGPGARPMHPDWARTLRDQCQALDVPFFFKQWGEWGQTYAEPGGDLGGDMRADRVRFVRPVGDVDGHFRKGDVMMRRVGKARAGRTLDGRTWDEMPPAPSGESS